MSDVTETLQQLVQRRQREMGGPRGPLSTRQVWLRGGGEDAWSYETVRRIVELGHHRIGDKVADRLAIALDIPVSRILAAAGQRPRLGAFKLPPRADRLNESERKVVLAVVDAILDAAKKEGEHGGDTAPIARPLRAVARRDDPDSSGSDET